VTDRHQAPSPIAIRLADAAADAAAVAAIYAPYVTDSIVSFELEPPSTVEMARRIESTMERTPWLVATAASEVVGYAYASAHREREGYRWSVDVSAYVRPDHHGLGIGKRLYGSLMAILRAQRFVNVYAGIALPNPASVALHEAVGMRRLCVYRGVGYKAGAWHDVAWYELELHERSAEPDEPIPLLALLGGDRGRAVVEAALTSALTD
jgi:L-amino acid N-acyltransferase YncA